jgi:glutathione S-transferase
MHEPYWALRGEMLKKEAERDQSIINEKRMVLRELMRYLEEELGDKPYFLGELSLTDIDLLARFFRFENYGALPDASLARLNVWLQKMKQRPSVKPVL